MSDPSIEEGTAKRIDAKYRCEVNLPANAPSGNPHIIKWNVGAKKDKIPHDLSPVDVVATILFEFHPSALSHLLDTEIEQFYCWWEVDGRIRDSEDNTKDNHSTISTEKATADSSFQGFTHIHRFGRFVRVGIVGYRNSCSDIEVSYCIRDEGNWEIVSSQDRRNNGDYFLYTSSPDICKAHDYQLAAAIICETDLEDKVNVSVAHHRNYELDKKSGTPRCSRLKTENITNAVPLIDALQEARATASDSERSSKSVKRKTSLKLRR